MPSVEDIVTAIVDGHTLTSPTVYYSFNYLRSLVGDLNLGTTVPNQIIPVNSADVSTMPCLPGPVPVLNTQYHAIDWSNLNAPVPAQAICCSGNLTDKQVTVYDDYAPILSIPQQVLEIDPAWSTCVPYFGVFDPPHALQGTPVAASPINTFAPDPTAIPETKAAPLPGPTARPAAPTATEPPPAPSSTPVVSNSGTLPSQSPAADPQSEQSGGSGPDSSNPASSAEDPLDPSEGGSSRHGDSPSDGNNDGRSDSESEVAGQGAGGAVASIMNDSPSSVPHAKSTSILISGGVDQGRSPGDVIGSVLAMPQGSGDSDADPSENSRGGDISQGGEFGSELGSGTSRGQSNENDASRNSGNNNEDASAASSVNNQESSDSGSQGHANDGPAGNQKLPASIIIGPSVIELPPDPSGHGVILPNGENLNPGQATTLGGTRISLAPGATAVEVGSKTIALSASSDVEVTEGAVQTEEAPAATQAVLTVGGSAVTAIERPGPSGETVAVVQGATLGVGGQLVTLRNGEVLSAGSHGVEVVDGGKTVAASWAPVPYNDASPAMTQALLTLDGTLITVSETPGPSGHTLVAVDGQTLTVGGRGAIVDGETLSAGDDGIVVVDGSSTSTASWSIDTSSSEIPEAVLTFDDGSIVTVTEKPGLSGHRSVVVVDGETLTVGGSAVEVNGELLSAGTNGIIVVDGGKTSTVPWKTTTGTSGSATGSGNGNYASRTGAASPLAGIPSAGRPRIDTRMANGVLGCWTAVAFAVLFVICL
ncbi:MAG: hypothetical protein M1820_003753 [Bogoriella megaspora]|nr:MAG: hypothetical protein M1820_003753 [Bogoriella megaspora]